MQVEIFKSHIIDNDIDIVWEKLKAFDSPIYWNPGVVDVSLKEVGAYNSHDVLRYITISNGSVFVEKLIHINEIEKYYTYEMVKSPYKITNYISNVRFIPISTSKKTLAIWESKFECEQDIHEEMIVYFGESVYVEGLRGMSEFMNGIDVNKELREMKKEATKE